MGRVIRSARNRGIHLIQADGLWKWDFFSGLSPAQWAGRKKVLEHKTQVQDAEKLIERFKSRRTEGSTDENPRYEEKFRVVKYE